VHGYHSTMRSLLVDIQVMFTCSRPRLMHGMSKKFGATVCLLPARVCDKACSEMSSILPYKLYPRVVEDPDAGRRKVGVDDEQRRRQF
jgi:hypothetical protein